MKHKILIIISLIGILLFSSCENRSLFSKIDADLNAYSTCQNNTQFKNWLYKDSPDDLPTIKEEDVKYKVYRSYDDSSKEVSIEVEIVNGFADYYKEEGTDSIENLIKEHVKFNKSVTDVYSDNVGWIHIVLNNPNEFDNHDDHN